MRTLKLIAFFLLLLPVSAVSSVRIDSILQTLSSLPDSQQIDSMTRIARLHAIQRLGVYTIEESRWALAEAKKREYYDLGVKAKFYLAAGFDENNQYDSSEYYYLQVLEELKQSSLEKWDVHVFLNLAYMEQTQGHFTSSIEYGLQGVRAAEAYNDSILMIRLFTNVGYSYDRMRQFRKALSWHKRSLEIVKLLGNDYELYFVLGRIGIAYDDLGIYDSAHYYNEQALEFAIEYQDTTEMGGIASNIGNTYTKQENWEAARKYLEFSYKLNEGGRNIGNQSISAINLGNVYIHLGRYEEAKQLLDYGIQKAIEWKGLKFESEGYYRYFQLYEKLERYDSALYYFQRHKNMEDSLYNLKKVEQIAELTTSYETEKKEQQIKYQALTLKEQEGQLDLRRRTNIALALLLLVIIVLSLAIYQRIRRKKERELQQAVISEQEKGLEAVIHAQEEERKRIAKDLHDGIGQQLSGVKMAFQKISRRLAKEDPSNTQELQQLEQIVSDSAAEVRTISHQMMPRVLLEIGLIAAIEDMLAKSLGALDFTYEFEHFGIEGRLAERVEISLYRICQELVNNIIKHSQATHVQIQLFKNKGKIIFIVEDNGKGIDLKKDGDGHGLMNIKSRLNTINGEVNYDSSPGGGTIATLRIPL